MKMPIRVLKGLLCMALCFTTATTFAKSSIECPSQNFKVFIKAFSNNVQIQKRFTAFPISVSAIDPTTADYSFKAQYIKRVDAQFPLFPLYKNRLAQNQLLTFFLPQMHYFLMKNFFSYPTMPY